MKGIRRWRSGVVRAKPDGREVVIRIYCEVTLGGSAERVEEGRDLGGLNRWIVEIRAEFLPSKPKVDELPQQCFPVLILVLEGFEVRILLVCVLILQLSGLA